MEVNIPAQAGRRKQKPDIGSEGWLLHGTPRAKITPHPTGAME
jgi:hypothetical protein